VPRAGVLITAPGVHLEIEHVGGNDREEHAAAIKAEAAEHRAGHEAGNGVQIVQDDCSKSIADGESPAPATYELPTASGYRHPRQCSAPGGMLLTWIESGYDSTLRRE
jgi:hypothetical protein